MSGFDLIHLASAIMLMKSGAPKALLDTGSRVLQGIKVSAGMTVIVEFLPKSFSV